MRIKKAVNTRILNLLEERGITLNTLAIKSGVDSTTIYSLFNGKSNNPRIGTIQKICDGLSISIKEFFDDKLFENIEQEIK